MGVPSACLESDRFEEEATSSRSGENWGAQGVKRAVGVTLSCVFCCGVAAVSGVSEMGEMASFFGVANMVGDHSALASGLLLMPPIRLVNRYYLVRSGESTFETRGVINTNPVAKTSVDSGLSEEGKKQTILAAKNLSALGACDDNCWIWPSINQRAYQTAEIIAYVNNVNLG